MKSSYYERNKEKWKTIYKAGHNAWRERSKKHLADYQRRWMEKNRALANARRVEYNRKNPERMMVAAAKKTATVKGLPFDLSRDDIIIPEFCPVLGMKLYRGAGERTDSSPSLDRIIPERGYVKGNVIVVSWRANAIKRDASVEEMRKLYEFYSKL